MHWIRTATLVALVGVFVFTPKAFAASQKEAVLGASVDPSEVVFPGLSSGPGYILPDNKLYPVDQLVQELRLLLAFTPEQQARVHMNIAGERLAELRVMMNRNNEDGIQLALQGYEKEVNDVASDLSDAAAKGRVNTELISSINEKLGEERDILGVAMKTASTRLGLKLASARQTALESKLRVAELLPEDQLAAVIKQDLGIEIDQEVLGVQTASGKLEEKMINFDKKASLSAEQKMYYEQLMASRSALKKDYTEQRKKLMEEYTEKRKKLQEERKKLYDQLKATTKALQDNQKALQQLEKSQGTLNGGILPSLTPNPKSN